MFSSILKELRTLKGISQIKLSKAIGVSAGNISDWESGRSKPGYSALVEIARFFEVSADYLLELQGEEWNNNTSIPQRLRVPLSPTELDLVDMFRFISNDDQIELLNLAYTKYQKNLEQKRESSLSNCLTVENNSEIA